MKLSDLTLNPEARRSVDAQIAARPTKAARPKEHSAGSIAATIKRRAPGTMTMTERRYADWLDTLKVIGQVRSWKYERMNLRIDTPGSGRAMTYRPDFIVWHFDGSLTFDEVKGRHIMQHSMVKFRAAVEVFPEFHFRMWQWKDGDWALLRESEKP